MTENELKRVLVYDIETSFNIGGYFGGRYDAHISKIVQPRYVFGFAYKWANENVINSCYIWDHTLYKRAPRDDYAVIKKWQELMSEADVVVGHNSDAFDNKVMTSRALVQGLPPISMPQSVDTYKVAKRIAKFDSNKLDDLSQFLGFGQKIRTDSDLWWDCMQGDEKAQAKMVKYNKQDVALTDKVYKRLFPYDQRHPNMANIHGRPESCPKCLAEGKLIAQGFRHTKTGTFRKFKCNNCLSWVQERLSEKIDRPRYV